MLQSENQQRSEATRAAKLCQEDGAAFCACGFCSRALLGARRFAPAASVVARSRPSRVFIDLPHPSCYGPSLT